MTSERELSEEAKAAINEILGGWTYYFGIGHQVMFNIDLELIYQAIGHARQDALNEAWRTVDAQGGSGAADGWNEALGEACMAIERLGGRNRDDVVYEASQKLKEATARIEELLKANNDYLGRWRALNTVVRACAEQFRFYEQVHRAKGPAGKHKADRNQVWAEMCEDAAESRPFEIPLPEAPEPGEALKKAVARYKGDWIVGMEDAPRDGTVIEACARYKDATAGSPTYVHFMHGEWREIGRTLLEPMHCWAWRERTDWPDEPNLTVIDVEAGDWVYIPARVHLVNNDQANVEVLTNQGPFILLLKAGQYEVKI